MWICASEFNFFKACVPISLEFPDTFCDIFLSNHQQPSLSTPIKVSMATNHKKTLPVLFYRRNHVGHPLLVYQYSLLICARLYKPLIKVAQYSTLCIHVVPFWQYFSKIYLQYLCSYLRIPYNSFGFYTLIFIILETKTESRNGGICL